VKATRKFLDSKVLNKGAILEFQLEGLVDHWYGLELDDAAKLEVERYEGGTHSSSVKKSV
jgi:hypothetical protein